MADHIKQMADLMHVYAIQNLEVALVGSPAAEAVDVLSAGLSNSNPVTITTAQPCPHTYTAIPPAPPQASVPIVGVSESSPIPVMATKESKPDGEIPTTSKTIKMKISDIPAPFSNHCQVSTALISPSISTMPSTRSAMPSNSSTASNPIVVVPELAIPSDAYQECGK